MKKEEVREITCIVCPVGCRAKVTIKNGKISKVENIECPRGEEYVLREINAPTRDFFTTVRVRGAGIPLCPVRAAQPIPKEKMPDCVLELAKIVVDAPIKAGDTIIKNLLSLGIDIIATRDLKRAKERPKIREKIRSKAV